MARNCFVPWKTPLASRNMSSLFFFIFWRRRKNSQPVDAAPLLGIPSFSWCVFFFIRHLSLPLVSEWSLPCNRCYYVLRYFDMSLTADEAYAVIQHALWDARLQPNEGNSNKCFCWAWIIHKLPKMPIHYIWWKCWVSAQVMHYNVCWYSRGCHREGINIIPFSIQ